MQTEIDQAESHVTDVARACSALAAVCHVNHYAYIDTATGAAYLVDDEALATFGHMLAEEVPDAYLRWCETTDATEIDGPFIIAMLERSHDLDALRAEADASADFDIVVAIDLLRPTLEGLLSELAAEDGPAEDDEPEWHTHSRIGSPAPVPGNDATLTEVQAGAERAHERVARWPAWKLDLSPDTRHLLDDADEDANDEVPKQGSDVVNTRGAF
jgi:hypothetical protein